MVNRSCSKHKKLILVGAGGNAKVIVDSLKARVIGTNEELNIIGFLDDDEQKHDLNGIPRIGKIDDLRAFINDDQYHFIDAIGNNEFRKLMYLKYPNVKWYTVIHPTAVISPFALIGEGSVVMPGAIINSGAKVGRKCLINTGAIVEHDNCIENYAHLASGVTTAGNVKIGECTLIGTGASILQGKSIGHSVTIGTGSVVITDIPDGSVAVGVPAKILYNKFAKIEE